MKLTIIGPVYPFRGGISHYTALLASALNESGHHTQVISFKRQYPSWLYPGKSDKDPSQEPQQVESLYLLDPFNPLTWIKTLREIRFFQPQAVVFQWWTTFWALPFACLAKSLRKAKLPVVFLIHNVMPHEQRSYDPHLARFALAPGNAFVVQTKKEADRLRTLIGDRTITLCRHPTYLFFRSGQIDRIRARESLGLAQDQFTLVFFGLIRPYKGLGVLLEALGILKKKNLSPSLIIAGEFWEPVTGYEKQIEELDLQQQVFIYNRYIPDEEVSRYFSAADCLVAPYTGGTQSGAATIAISFGIPLIVSEIVAEGISEEYPIQMVTVVPCGDAHALAGAIRDVMNETRYPQKTPQTQSGWDCLVETIVRLTDQCKVTE